VESVLLFILGVVIVLIGLALSIGLHEMGHLVPAKLFGVKVTQYMIGFGNTLFSRRRGETEYGVKAIPLGGYIAMVGMFPPERGSDRPRDASTGFMQTMVQDGRASAAPGTTSPVAERTDAGGVFETAAEGPESPGRPTMAQAADDDRRSFYRLAVYKRIIIMLGGPFMNLVIALVLYAVLGLVGLPVYAPQDDGSHLTGLLALAAPSFGYIIGFIPSAALVGWLAERQWDRKILKAIVTFVAGSVVVFAIGLPWLAVVLHTDLPTTLQYGLYPFIIGGIIKAAIAAGLLPLAWWGADRIAKKREAEKSSVE